MWMVGPLDGCACTMHDTCADSLYCYSCISYLWKALNYSNAVLNYI